MLLKYAIQCNGHYCREDERTDMTEQRFSRKKTIQNATQSSVL